VVIVATLSCLPRNVESLPQRAPAKPARPGQRQAASRVAGDRDRDRDRQRLKAIAKGRRRSLMGKIADAIAIAFSPAIAIAFSPAK
jgi:hypothetical protein